MGRPLRIEYPGAFYHVTARGNEQRDIYKSRADRERFLDYLVSSSERYGAVIHVWCLMSNHYQSAHGDAVWEFVADHAAYQRGLYKLLQYQA